MSGPHGQAGAAGPRDASVSPQTLLPLSSPGLGRQQALVVAGMALPCLAAERGGNTAAPLALGHSPKNRKKRRCC